MLDFLIAVNILLALVILLTTMFVKKPLDFSVFPSLLLVATLFRLGLNVASTRLVLRRRLRRRGHRRVRAHRGRRLDDHRRVIFLILVVIQFVVITKGAERVAEVGARFTLDAMPGKQMAIDADLNAGLITDVQARERRAEVSAEADFYGAMDGASKFVKGDAIAGIIIIIINIVGGIAIGMVQRGMSIRRRAEHLRPADHRRRPGHPDPGAAHGGVHRHDRHPVERRGGHGLPHPPSSASPATR